MPTMLQERIDLTQLQEAPELPTVLPQKSEDSVQQLSQEDPMPIFPVAGENQAGPNALETVTASEYIEDFKPQVDEFQDKHGTTRYMKKGVNAKTGHKYTSFIKKEEADRLRGTDLVEELPDFLKQTVVRSDTDKTPLTDDVEEISGEHLAIPSQAHEDVLTADNEALDEFYAKTGYVGKHFAKEYQPKHAKNETPRRARIRQFLSRAVSKANVYLGLADDPERTVTKLPPNYHEKNQKAIDEAAAPEPWNPPVHPEDLVSKPVSGEVKITAERAVPEKQDQAA